MADLRLWSKEMIADFIEMYKSFPCLWKVKCEEYKNKYIKSNAYKELVQFCKKRGFPEATRDFVVRKLQSLRGSFRKELRKTRQYQRSGVTYQSNLWYYNNLLFTRDQETETSEDTDDGNQSTEENYQSNEDVYDDAVDDEEKFMVRVKPSAKIVNIPDDYSADSPQSPSPPPKRRKRTTVEDCLQPEFLDIDSTRQDHDSSKLKDLSEFELTGMYITNKLARIARMDPTQAIYAESIINNVIRKGLLRKLKWETDLCDNLCGRKILTVTSLPPQSSSANDGVSLKDIKILPNTSI